MTTPNAGTALLPRPSSPPSNAAYSEMRRTMVRAAALFVVVILVVLAAISLLPARLLGSSHAAYRVARRMRPCDPSSGHDTYPFCNTSLPRSERIESLLSLLTPREKIGLLGNTASPGAPRLGIPPYEWWNEALHGVGKSPGITFDSDAGTGHATSFPQICSIGPSFNRTLFSAMGDAIGLEARAFHNAGRGGLTYWAPNVNIFRDPRWGRGQEVPGEDPYLNGEYAANFVPALQWGLGPGGSSDVKEESSQRRPRVAAACKHLAAYSLETGRLSFNAVVTDTRDMDDSYLPAFDACVRRGGALGVMCSYNAINGVPSCANPELLKSLLREGWKFDGYITGDCGAVENVETKHHYVDGHGETCRDVLRSGVDLDCGNFLQRHGADAYHDGLITDDDIDSALGILFDVQMRLGYFDPPELDPWNNVSTNVIGNSRHSELALDAARQGVVLLKNGHDDRDPRNISSPDRHRPLPLDTGIHKKIALLGPNADANVTMQGNYEGIAPYLITVKDGFDSLLGADNVAYHKGCDINGSVDNPGEVCDAVINDADAVVLVVGLDQSLERESLDRKTLELPVGQDALIDVTIRCAAASSKPDVPIILVVMAGGPVDLGPYAGTGNSTVSGIFYVGYPGQSGGLAVAEAVYGRFSPSGRLTTSVYPSSFTNEVALSDMGMRPNATTGNPGRTYRFYTGGVVYPFGHGLSYTEFQYAVVDKTRTSLKIRVTNVGGRAGADSLLLFHSGRNAGVDGEPKKQLVAFEKLFLEPGEEHEVDFVVPSRPMEKFDGIHRFMLGPTEDHVFEIEVEREDDEGDSDLDLPSVEKTRD